AAWPTRGDSRSETGQGADRRESACATQASNRCGRGKTGDWRCAAIDQAGTQVARTRRAHCRYARAAFHCRSEAAVARLSAAYRDTGFGCRGGAARAAARVTSRIVGTAFVEKRLDPLLAFGRSTLRCDRPAFEGHLRFDSR